jgi:hypothetical protein
MAVMLLKIAGTGWLPMPRFEHKCFDLAHFGVALFSV